MQQAKIKPLTPKKQAQRPANHAKATKRRQVHMRRLKLLFAALAIICVVGAVQLVRVHQSIARSQAQVDTAQHQLAKTKAKKAALKVQVDQLKNSDYLAKLVREKYLVSKQGETVFSLPGLSIEPNSASNSSQPNGTSPAK